MLKKKIKKKIIIALAPVVLVGAFVLVIVCALVTLDFFGTNETDGYVEENEAIINQSNNLNNSEKKRSHLEYVFKNNFSKINKSCNEFEKSKTFIKQMNGNILDLREFL